MMQPPPRGFRESSRAQTPQWHMHQRKQRRRYSSWLLGRPGAGECFHGISGGRLMIEDTWHTVTRTTGGTPAAIWHTHYSTCRLHPPLFKQTHARHSPPSLARTSLPRRRRRRLQRRQQRRGAARLHQVRQGQRAAPPTRCGRLVRARARSIPGGRHRLPRAAHAGCRAGGGGGSTRPAWRAGVGRRAVTRGRAAACGGYGVRLGNEGLRRLDRRCRRATSDRRRRRRPHAKPRARHGVAPDRHGGGRPQPCRGGSGRRAVRRPTRRGRRRGGRRPARR